MTQQALFALTEAQPDQTTSQTIPAWLAEQLEHPNTRDPRRTHWARCRHCNAIILTGDDADIGATTATADPTPLDPTAEATAILAGRDIYLAVPANTPTQTRTYKLHHITPTRHLRGAGFTLIPAHTCHQPIAPPTLTAPDPTTHPDDPLPF